MRRHYPFRPLTFLIHFNIIRTFLLTYTAIFPRPFRRLMCVCLRITKVIIGKYGRPRFIYLFFLFLFLPKLRKSLAHKILGVIYYHFHIGMSRSNGYLSFFIYKALVFFNLNGFPPFPPRNQENYGGLVYFPYLRRRKFKVYCVSFSGSEVVILVRFIFFW